MKYKICASHTLYSLYSRYCKNIHCDVRNLLSLLYYSDSLRNKVAGTLCFNVSLRLAVDKTWQIFILSSGRLMTADYSQLRYSSLHASSLFLSILPVKEGFDGSIPFVSFHGSCFFIKRSCEWLVKQLSPFTARCLSCLFHGTEGRSLSLVKWGNF